MTSQVVQRARLLRTCIYALWGQRAKGPTILFKIFVAAVEHNIIPPVTALQQWTRPGIGSTPRRIKGGGGGGCAARLPKPLPYL